MTFANDPVPLDALASVDAIQTAPIERAYANIGFALWTGAALVGVAAVTVVTVLGLRPVDGSEPLTGSLAVGTLVLIAVGVYLHRRSFRYGLRQHDFVLEKGVLWQHQIVQPLCRVQHVEIQQGPLEKRFELSRLSLYSAGSAAATFEVPGLRRVDAERMRAEVLRYTSDSGGVVAEPAA